MQKPPPRCLGLKRTQMGVLVPAVLFAWMAAVAPAASQTQATSPASVPGRATLPDGKPLTGSAANQLIERIQVDDADIRIEEARFGGETRSITVIPKGGFPAYDVRPSTGRSTWKIFGF